MSRPSMCRPVGQPRWRNSPTCWTRQQSKVDVVVPALPYVPVEELGDRPHVLVDGATRAGSVLTLSHWPQSPTPAALARDTSAQIVFAFLHAARGDRALGGGALGGAARGRGAQGGEAQGRGRTWRRS